jgi:protein ImuB
MRRVICIFLPHWSMELRLRRLQEAGRTSDGLQDKPLVIANLEDQQRIVLAVNAAAAADGLTPGLSLAHARAVQPQLVALPAQPLDDARALERLASWCLRYSPLVAPCGADSIWIDATGATHLCGGEEKMLHTIQRAMAGHGLTARVAMAATPGAAWALSHFSPQAITLSDAPADLSALPITALRLALGTARSLWRVGIKTIADLRRIPRATLPRRFGKDVLARLDQALGHAPEAIDAVLPPRAKRKRLTFAEPISTDDDLKRAIGLLAPPLCADLEKSQEGARRLDLMFFRTDNRVETIRLSLARPSRTPAHFEKLLRDKVETVDPGFGIETAVLTAWRVEPLLPHQTDVDGLADGNEDISNLVDSLVNQVGARNVYRIASFASDIPERVEKRVNPAAPSAASWPAHLPRPVRLFAPPEVVEVMAMMPDHPPLRFMWRGEARMIKRADGPERVFGEWWQDPKEVAEVRDYFRVEDEQGERFWLYRDGRLTADSHYRWYVHGVFA